MISRNAPARQPSGWQRALAQAITDPLELLNHLDLPLERFPSPRPRPGFALRVPRGYAARMRKGDPDDPLLRQVLPLMDEDRPAPGFEADPVGDLHAERRPGVLHKYQGRVLLVATGACAIHCRYCFRQHFPYAESNPLKGHWAQTLAGIAADPSIEEVILSGGDPLTLTDDRLAALAEDLCAVPHVRRLRFHTRLPIVLPERIDRGFLTWLAGLPVNTVMVVHANHANEIDDRVRGALGALKTAGTTLLNQAVLLRGVNDHSDTLRRLSEALFDAGVLPYYLHLLDKVTGTAHFDVPEATAVKLLAGLNRALPGYLVPRLVREVPGAAHKVMLFP